MTLPRFGIAIVVAFLTAACAQSARELPPDMSRLAPEDRLQPGDRDDPTFALQCSDISQVVVDVKKERAQHEAKIAEARARNQGAIYFGALLFPPAVLLAEPNTTAIKAIQKLDERAERLDRIRAAKRCAGP